MVYVLVGVFLALTLFDYWFTRRQILRHGPEVEINPIIKLGVKTFGLDKGLLLVGAFYTLPVVLAALFKPSPIVIGLLLFVTGYRVAYFNVQLAGLAFEEQMEEIIKRIKKEPFK